MDRQSFWVGTFLYTESSIRLFFTCVSTFSKLCSAGHWILGINNQSNYFLPCFLFATVHLIHFFNHIGLLFSFDFIVICSFSNIISPVLICKRSALTLDLSILRIRQCFYTLVIFLTRFLYFTAPPLTHFEKKWKSQRYCFFVNIVSLFLGSNTFFSLFC